MVVMTEVMMGALFLAWITGFVCLPLHGSRSPSAAKRPVREAAHQFQPRPLYGFDGLRLKCPRWFSQALSPSYPAGSPKGENGINC